MNFSLFLASGLEDYGCHVIQSSDTWNQWENCPVIIWTFALDDSFVYFYIGLELAPGLSLYI